MRLMEVIRRKGHWFLIGFLIIFTISLFFGLTAGFNGQGAGCAPTPGGPQPTSGKPPVIVQDKGGQDTAVLVNGRKISNSVYKQVVDHFIEQYSLRSVDDPTAILTANGYAVNMLARQEVLMAYGEEHNIQMTAADWEKAKADVSAGLIQKNDEKSGSLVKDALGKLNDMKAQKAAFEQYLSSVGETESQWEKDAQRDLYTRKVQDAITEEMNAAKKEANKKKEDEIDKALASGKPFADVAKEFSEGPQKDTGGDVNWIGRGLLDPEVSGKVFATEKGKTTDWIETPAWLKKFLIVDKKEAKGPEFEGAKPGIIKSIQGEKKDPNYKPTAEEIANKYEQVQARVIDIAVTDDNKANEKVQAMIDSAKVEINNPYALAYQALKDYRIQPLDSVTKDELIKIASLAPIGDGYNWDVLDKKLAAGKPKAAKPDEKTAAEKDAAGKTADGKDSSTLDASGAASMTDSAKDEAEKVMTPIYALAVGLIEKGNQDSNNASDQWPMYMEAKVLFDWLKDSAEANKQPIKTKEARAKLEDLLAQVVKANNYSANAHAMRGLNLARLEKPKEAADELAIAEKYAPSQPGEVWDTIREGYKVLDNTAKLAEIDKKIQDMQQKQFQEMIQRQLQQQGAGQGGQSIPIQIPGK